MKKALVLLLAIMATAGIVFAEDAAPKVESSVAGTILMMNSVAQNSFGTLTLNDDLYVMDLDANITFGSFGAFIELETDMGSLGNQWVDFTDGLTTANFKPNNFAFLNYGYAQMSFFNDMWKVKFGLFSTSAYRYRQTFGRWVLWTYSDAIVGNYLSGMYIVNELAPIEGLLIATYTPVGQTVVDRNSWDPINEEYTANQNNEGALSDALAQTDLFVKYSMKDVGKFYFNFSPDSADYSAFDISGAAVITAVKPFSFLAGGRYWYVKDNKAKTYTNLYLGATYNDMGINATEQFKLSLKDGLTLWTSVTSVSYTWESLVPQLDFAFGGNSLDSTISYWFTPGLSYNVNDYTLINVQFQYKGSTLAGSTGTWVLPINLMVSF